MNRDTSTERRQWPEVGPRLTTLRTVLLTKAPTVPHFVKEVRDEAMETVLTPSTDVN